MSVSTIQHPPGNVLKPAPMPQEVQVTRFQCPEPGCDTLSETKRGVRHHATRVHGERLTKILMACVHCRDTFYVKPSRRDSARYCSRDCQTAAGTQSPDPNILSTPPEPVETTVTRYQCPCEGCGHLSENQRGAQKHVTDVHPEMGQATLACERCDRVFHRKASAVSYARYCSRRCRDRARRRRVVLRCEACDDLFCTHQYRADVARFCSYRCWQFHGLSIPNLVRTSPTELGLLPIGKVRPSSPRSYIPDGVGLDV